MAKTSEKIKSTLNTTYRILKIFWGFDKPIFLGNLFFITLPSTVEFLNAYIYKLIIDLVINSINGLPTKISSLYWLLIARVGTFIIQDLFYSLQKHFNNLLWTKFPLHLYQKYLGFITNLDLEYFENSDFKNKLEKVRNSYAWKPQNLINSAFYTFEGVTQVAIAIVAIAYLNWILLIPIIIAATLGLIIQTKTSEVAWGIWSDLSPHRKKYWYLSGLIEGGYSGESIKEIKIFRLANRFLQELKDIYTKFDTENTNQSIRQFKVNIAHGFINNIVYICIELYVILSAIAKKITIGDASYYTAVTSRFQSGVNGLFRNITNLYDNSLYVKDMFEILDTPKILLHSPNPKKLITNETPKIEFKNVFFKYPQAKNYTLKNFNLIINPGEKIALVGENGAGKSTIIKLLARFYDVTSGEILINNKNIKHIEINTWHKTLGILFQDYIKYQHTLEDNIYFGKVYVPKSKQKIIDASKKSGADGVANVLPNKYQQMLGKTFEGGVELSNGQWQKVALGRAYLRNAPILILDEPTASIDAKAEYEIFKKVDTLSKNKTVIIISHRFSTVRNADKIFVLKKGSIEESGSHQQLLENNGIYAQLFRLQAKGYQ